MAPPKAGAKKGEEDQVTQAVVASNYSKVCRSISIQPNSAVLDVLRGSEEDEGPLRQLVLNEDVGKLGSGGIRAITTAFLGVGPNLTSGPYKLLNSIRIWKCYVGDDGAAAIASLLTKGDVIQITYLELMDCQVGEEGCRALGEALDGKHNSSLLTLKLDYNASVGDNGVTALCKGLFTNQVLKKLFLEYCNIGPEGAMKLGQVLSMPKSALTTLSIQGNSIGAGLQQLARGVKRSKAITALNLADNAISGESEAIAEFRDALLGCPTLSNVDFTFNPLSIECAELLLPALDPSNKKLTTFLIDSSLNPELFQKLNRQQQGGKGGGKKKGKKKK